MSFIKELDAITEPIGFIKVGVQTQENSIIPSIAEAERFIKFMSDKFKIGIPNNLIINIQSSSPKIKGFFMPKESEKSYLNINQSLNLISLNSLYLKNEPYETITHEFAHFINHIKGIKDASSSGYHNKKFKQQAEVLFLEVIKGEKGFNITKTTPQFLEMLKEFIPNNHAFHIEQQYTESQKKGSRNLLYMCKCGCKIRTAKNENKPLKAMCLYCNTEFKEGERESED